MSEEDKRRQKQRENMQREAESLFSKEEKRERRRKEAGRPRATDQEAQKIYREILEVVKENSPASLQYGRGRMVGYGEKVQDTLR